VRLTKADIGKRIVLAPFEDEPREIATVLEVSRGMVICQVRVKKSDMFDDGRRECDFSQVERFHVPRAKK
jgi:hypothetical protein